MPVKNKTLIISALLIGITLTIYLPVTQNSFINFDDGMYVFANPMIKSPITLKNVYWAFTTFYAANWHPLTWLSHMLDYKVFGLNAGGHHLTSLLIHLTSTVLLFLVFDKMTRRRWPSAFIAAAFAVHPFHVESVAWVAERKDVLCAFFWILTMGAYARYVANPQRGQYGLVLLTFILGLMAKPMMVTLPFVLLLLDYWPLHRFILFDQGDNPNGPINGFTYPQRRFLALIVEKIPFFLLSAFFAIVTYYAQQSANAVNQLIPLSARIFNALISYITYVGKMFWPLPLSVFYPYQVDRPIWQILSAGLMLGLISLQVLRKSKSYPYLLVGWFWFMGTLVPVIGLVQVGSQSMADRYTYLPSVGIFIIIAWSLADLSVKWPYRKIVLSLSAAVGLSFLMVLTWTQVGYWQNSLSLFQHAVKVTTGNFKANDLLGFTYMEQGKLDQAIFHFREAIRIKPDYGSAHNNLGLALERQGKVNQAITQYLEAIRFQPGCSEAHYNLGIIMFRQGKPEAAIAYFNSALRINRQYAEAYNNLGVVLYAQGKIAEAIELYSRALEIKPLYADAHYNLANALTGEGRFDEAIEHYTKALRIKPAYDRALNNLGLAQARKGMLKEAVISFRKALTINPDLSEAKENLNKVLDLK